MDVLANDSPTLGIVNMIQPLRGFASQTAEGKVNYVPNVGFAGLDRFWYTVSDDDDRVLGIASVSVRVFLVS